MRRELPRRTARWETPPRTARRELPPRNGRREPLPRAAGNALAGDRLRLAILLSINFLSRNDPNEPKKLMLTPGGRGRSALRGGRKILVPQPWELETFAPGMRWPETG